MAIPLKKERLAEKLLSSAARRKLGLLAFCFLLATPFLWIEWESEGDSESPLSEIFMTRDLDSKDDLPQPVAERTTISESSRVAIESLFNDIKTHPENQEKSLKELRRLLQEVFAGQEDCWSCEGTAFFDRFDQIAGQGQARKPIGLREWIEQGDEAFDKEDPELARKYYSKALQVMDERVFQPDESIDEKSLERLQKRCVELDCR
ncbi:MAG: hypothetical protein ACAH59_13475 [Pseudobdellovibrionaceae bacterium]